MRRFMACLFLIGFLGALPVTGQVDLRSNEAKLRQQLRRRGLNLEELSLPHAVNEEMRVWLREVVPPRVPEEHRISTLLSALLGHNDLDLQYHPGYTGTAIEIFESGRANCLGFTHLFVALSRELGLPVYYLKVNDIESYEREGDLVVVSGHITAGFGPPNRPEVLEFSLFPAATYRDIRPLSDLSAVALFYSNRGAEQLLDKDPAGAVSWLETAVQIDPELPEASVNLGVAYRRLARFDDAEASYRRALAVDPDTTSAYRNLSALLSTMEGRQEEGRQLLALIDQKQSRNPFNFLSLGDLALSEGRLEDAGGYYRRSLQLGPRLADTHAAMGAWALASGERGRARRWLRKARKLEPENPRVLALSKALG